MYVYHPDFCLAVQSFCLAAQNFLSGRPKIFVWPPKNFCLAVQTFLSGRPNIFVWSSKHVCLAVQTVLSGCSGGGGGGDVTAMVWMTAAAMWCGCGSVTGDSGGGGVWCGGGRWRYG